jgi:uncharacterized protein (TIGR02145 family)
MKQSILKINIVFLVLGLFMCQGANAQGIGINETGLDPHPAAMLDVSSTTKGFLPPRMTSLQRDAIASPAVGLVIYNTTTNCLNFYIGSGWNETCGTAPQPSYPVGSVFCASGLTTVVNVTNPTTGKIWMDRNLGASQAATSLTDPFAYGDLYQWGRGNDGHQCRTSATTTTLTSADQPANGNFIIASNSPFDWRSPQNINLWQGVNGVNNPCPSGYRIPTEAELNAERLSWSSQNSAGAFASLLKFPMTGSRASNDGLLYDVGTHGYCWSSAVSSTNSSLLYINSNSGIMFTYYRSQGFPVRCIKH